MMFDNPQELYSKFISDVIDCPPKWACILTYGIWAGVDEDGKKIANCSSYRFLLGLELHDVKTIIGVGISSFKHAQRIVGTSRAFPKIKFIAIQDMHSKCMLTSSGILAMGSANITDTKWPELIYYTKIDPNCDDFKYATIIIKGLHLKGIELNPGNMPEYELDGICRSFGYDNPSPPK
jgi:hypothetical protein